jgi:hypothetical protein
MTNSKAGWISVGAAVLSLAFSACGLGDDVELGPGHERVDGSSGAGGAPDGTGGTPRAGGAGEPGEAGSLATDDQAGAGGEATSGSGGASGSGSTAVAGAGGSTSEWFVCDSPRVRGYSSSMIDLPVPGCPCDPAVEDPSCTESALQCSDHRWENFAEGCAAVRTPCGDHVCNAVQSCDAAAPDGSECVEVNPSSCLSPTQNLARAFTARERGCVCDPEQDESVCAEGIALVCNAERRWQATGGAPCVLGAECFSPVHNAAAFESAPGCPCDEAFDAGVCLGRAAFTCLDGRWAAVVDGACTPGISCGSERCRVSESCDLQAPGGPACVAVDPDACFSPTQNVYKAYTGQGCVCDPTTSEPVCVDGAVLECGAERRWKGVVGGQCAY